MPHRGLGGRESPDLEAFALQGVLPDKNAEASTEHFLMYGYKVIPCSKRYRHDWSVCPFAHNGEMAARRDPRLYQPMFCYHSKQRLPCPRGDACPYAHNLFEYWLHPARYRTEMCQFGIGCTRPVCFFAHGEAQRRITGIAGGPQPVVAPPEPLVVGEGGLATDPLVVANIQKAALEQLQLQQQAQSDVLPMLGGAGGQTLTAAAAAANLGAGITAPLPQGYNVPGPAAAVNGGFGGLPSSTMGLSSMNSMDPMGFQAALAGAAVTSNPVPTLDGLSLAAAGGVHTSELVSQLLASAQQQQQQAAAAASTATMLEELSRQLATLEMQQSSQSAPLPHISAKVAAAAAAGALAHDGSGLVRLGSDAQALAHMLPDLGRDATGGSFTLGTRLGGSFTGPSGGAGPAGNSGPLPELFGLQQPWVTPAVSSGLPFPPQHQAHQQQQQQEHSGPLGSFGASSSSKMKPWSAPASPTSDNKEGGQPKADAQLGSLSFSTGVRPSAELLEQLPKGARPSSLHHSLPLQPLGDMRLLPHAPGAAVGEELGGLTGAEPSSSASLGGLPSSNSSASIEDAAPLMLIGDAPVRSDQLRDKLLGSAAAAEAAAMAAGLPRAAAGRRNGMGSGGKHGHEREAGAPASAPLAGISERPLEKQTSTAVQEATRMLSQMPEEEVKQLLDLMKQHHSKLPA